MEKKVAILNQQQINQKLQRMAFEILERNHTEKSIVLLGIESGGKIIAQQLQQRLSKIADLKITVKSLDFDKKNPSVDEISITHPIVNENIIIVDDVANSGKTLAYALAAILKFNPKKVEVVVLVDRHHKHFPIKPDVVGHSVSTTLQEHIFVEFDKNFITGAYLA